MNKRKQQWLQTYTRNAQTSDNNIQYDNTWSTYTTYSHRPYETKTNFQNHYYGVPYTNKYNGCENYDCSEIINSSNDDSDAESKPTPLQDKTVIKKEGLYKDADSFRDNDFSRDKASSSTSANANTGTWTEAFWQKEDDNKSQSPGYSLGKFKTRNRKNKLERSLNKMLAQPVEMSKGKSLLEKMGWQGGGLGKDGDGIVEPIAPEATYAVKTMGLGHGKERNNVAKKKTAKPAKNKINKAQFKGNFCTNVLLNILDFVQNDRTIEMLFDTHLFNGERKRIHKIVEQIRELDNLDDFKGFKDTDLDIVKDIWVHNVYILWTQSDGELRNRQLCLYKEAPEHVYLVTPDDLRDEDEKIDKDIEEKKYKQFPTNNSNDINENTDKQKETVITNDVDEIDITNDKDITLEKDITLDKDIEEESHDENTNSQRSNEDANKKEHNAKTKEVTESMLAKLVGYFKQFADVAIYTEFRCLGPFNDDEVNNLKLLFDICMRKDDNDSQEKVEMVKVLDNSAFVFDVQEDMNGSMVICKTERY